MTYGADSRYMIPVHDVADLAHAPERGQLFPAIASEACRTRPGASGSG